MKLEIKSPTELSSSTLPDSLNISTQGKSTNDISLDIKTTRSKDSDLNVLLNDSKYSYLYMLRRLLIFQIRKGKPILVFGPHCNNTTYLIT